MSFKRIVFIVLNFLTPYKLILKNKRKIKTILLQNLKKAPVYCKINIFEISLRKSLPTYFEIKEIMILKCYILRMSFINLRTNII